MRICWAAISRLYEYPSRRLWNVHGVCDSGSMNRPRKHSHLLATSFISRYHKSKDLFTTAKSTQAFSSEKTNFKADPVRVV